MSCPADLEHYSKAYMLAQKETDSNMWAWWGTYGLSATLTAIDRALNGKYHFYKLDADYGKWTDYLSKCVMVFQKNRGLKQDGYVGLITTYYLLKG